MKWHHKLLIIIIGLILITLFVTKYFDEPVREGLPPFDQMIQFTTSFNSANNIVKTIKDQIYQTTKVVTDKAADVAEIGRDAGYAAQEGARDVAIAGAESFNWDNIYVVPDEYAFHIDNAIGENIRYGLPVGEEFVSPKKRQYYGHPALYDLKTGKTMKNVCDARKRGLKKTYEMNQLRIKNIETSVFNFKSYNISHNFTNSIGIGSTQEHRVVSPSSIFSQGFDSRLFNEPTSKNRKLFRRSIGEEISLY